MPPRPVAGPPGPPTLNVAALKNILMRAGEMTTRTSGTASRMVSSTNAAHPSLPRSGVPHQKNHDFQCGGGGGGSANGRGDGQSEGSGLRELENGSSMAGRSHSSRDGRPSIEQPGGERHPSGPAVPTRPFRSETPMRE